MKKILIFSLVVGAIALTACKKDHTCSCTVLGFTVDTTFTDMSKSDAKTACDEQNSVVGILGGSCELK